MGGESSGGIIYRMSKPYAKQLALFSLFLSVTVVSYSFFVTYKPKILSSLEISQVRGAKTDKFSVVYPLGAKEIGVSRTSTGKLITITTTQSPLEVISFYKNIFGLDNWKLEREGKAGLFWTVKFKKDDLTILVTSSLDQSSYQGKDTIATIAISSIN